MRKSIIKWRVNYVVVHQNGYSANVYRKQVLEILQNIARIREIDYAVSVDHQFSDVQPRDDDKLLKDAVFDLVYFRSSMNTKISGADFRKMIDMIFEEHRFLELGKHPFEVFSQLQKNLNEFPFPEDLVLS